MAFDYSVFTELAEELITEFGRPIVLETAADLPFIDPAKPWKGRDLSVVDAELFPVYGVFVPPNQVRIFGLSALGDATEFQDVISRSEQLIMVRLYEGVDLRRFAVVTDRNQEWQITGLQQLQPGPVPIMAYIGVRR